MADPNNHPVILWSRRSEDFFSELRARFSPEGDLIVEGQDIGGSVEAFWGSDEYEYFITVRKTAIERLADALAQTLGEPPPDADGRHDFIMDALQRLFSDEKLPGCFTTSSDFRAWLKSGGIESEFSSWT